MEMEIAIKLETKMTRLTAVGCAAMITSSESISLLLLMGIVQRGERVAFWGGEALFPKGILHGGDRVVFQGEERLPRRGSPSIQNGWSSRLGIGSCTIGSR